MNDRTRLDLNDLPQKYESLILSVYRASCPVSHNPDMKELIRVVRMLRDKGVEEEHSACVLVALACIACDLASIKKRFCQLKDFRSAEIAVFYDQAKNTSIRFIATWLVYGSQCQCKNAATCGRRTHKLHETTEFLYRLLHQHFPELASFNNAS